MVLILMKRLLVLLVKAQRDIHIPYYLLLLRTGLFFRSYEEMTKEYKTDLICELKYINSYYSSEVCENYVTPNDTIQWIAMNSLVHSDKKVWMPLQFVTMYTEENVF